MQARWPAWGLFRGRPRNTVLLLRMGKAIRFFKFPLECVGEKGYNSDTVGFLRRKPAFGTFVHPTFSCS